MSMVSSPALTTQGPAATGQSGDADMVVFSSSAGRVEADSTDTAAPVRRAEVITQKGHGYA